MYLRGQVVDYDGVLRQETQLSSPDALWTWSRLDLRWRSSCSGTRHQFQSSVLFVRNEF